MQPCLGNHARPAAGHFAGQLRNDSLRQSVGFNLVVAGQIHQGRRIHQSAGDAALEHAGMAETGRPFEFAITNTNCMNQTKSRWRACFQKARLDGFQNGLGHPMTTARSTDENGVPRLNQIGRLLCCNDFHE